MKRMLPALLLVVSGAALAAETTPVTVTRKDCQKLLRPPPAAADYQPGVDARGKKVKGAEVDNQQRLDLPKEISFDLNLDLAKRAGLDSKSMVGEANMGKVTVQPGGQVLFNGKPLGKAETAAVEEACRKAYGTRR